MGKLYYFMGGSGSGKDSLMQLIRQQFDGDILVAPRYITRAADAGDENHFALTSKEFALRQQLGLFAMHWCANGLHYGIGNEVHDWLKLGKPILLNGSRAYYQQAKAKFTEQLQGIWIDVDERILAQRLTARARESDAEIAQRLSRHEELKRPVGDVAVINNNGSLAQSLDQFVALLEDCRFHSGAF